MKPNQVVTMVPVSQEMLDWEKEMLEDSEWRLIFDTEEVWIVLDFVLFVSLCTIISCVEYNSLDPYIITCCKNLKGLQPTYMMAIIYYRLLGGCDSPLHQPPLSYNPTHPM